MTPAARIAASIEILDDILAGENAEKRLTNWARSNRFAGSKDRQAIRDYVFSILRCMRSCAWLGGAGLENPTARQLLIGHLRSQNAELTDYFNETSYSAPLLEEHELSLSTSLKDAPEAVQFDIPDWMLPLYQHSLSNTCAEALRAMQKRAPLYLRVNLRKSTVEQARNALQKEGIETQPHPLSPTALTVLTKPRTVINSAAYRNGLVEIQDAGSQKISDILPLEEGMKVLDFCAGGGGKSLAMAARKNVEIHAYDINQTRMNDVQARAERAGVEIKIAEKEELQSSSYDLVLCDVPCSGSGTFSRTPQAKWDLNEEKLNGLIKIQADILNEAYAYVKTGGILAYATCSAFHQENSDIVNAALSQKAGLKLISELNVPPSSQSNGFYISILQKN